MVAELYTNNYTTTLNGAVASTDTTVTVHDILPPDLRVAGQWRLLVESEIMLVTAVDSTFLILTVVRAQENTLAAAHTSGIGAAQIITKGAMDNILQNMILCDVYANLPPAGKPGRLFIPQNHVCELLRDNGSSWDHFFRGQKLTLPQPSTFTWVNQGTFASFSTAKGITEYTVQNSGGERLLCIAAPSTPYSIRCCMLPNTAAKQYQSFGCGFRESVSGKLHLIQHMGLSATTPIWTLRSTKYTNETTYNSDFYTMAPGDIYPWMKITDDGTNRSVSVSRDGNNWIVCDTEPRTTFLTADQVVGISASADNNESGTAQINNSINWLHWGA